MTRRFPMPPAEGRLHHHQVWLVQFERRLRDHEVEFGMARKRFEPHYVMLVDPREYGWRPGRWGFWRTNLRLGAIWERDEADIWTDLNKLRWHESPYSKNFTPNLRMHRGDYIYWENPVSWER